jgi:hypothetical protein
MHRWEPCVLLLAAVIGTSMAAGACRRGDPPPAPSTSQSTTPVRVTGTEKVVWDQAADDAAALARYRYIVFIDDVPVDLTGATCSTTATNMKFPCSAALPKLSPGSHRLELAVVEDTEAGRRPSLKSGVLLLDVQPANTAP